MAKANLVQDHVPIVRDKFGGVYSRDDFYDSVPADHFITGDNVISNGDEITTRYGFTKDITLANIRRTFVYKREGEADRVLALTTSGHLYDTTASLSTPILTITDMTDFSCLTYYNRCFISPHNGVKGLPSEKLYVYQGSGLARAAAGDAPTTGFTAGESISSGVVEEGLHIFAVSFETDSGFITIPGPAVFPTVQATGTQSIDLTNLPIGPSGTIKRRILASRAITDYNGDQEGYEMFFVPGTGTIDDNTSTTVTVNFYDADLQVTADYLFDQLSEIPAGVFLASYAGMMVIGGEDANPSLARVSKANEPESFNELAGFIVCDPFETEGVKGAVEFRDNLYITKGNPGHLYTTKDNGYDASTWFLTRIDSSVGADINGISQFLDTKGANSDFFLMSDPAGLFLFNGALDVMPITYKINHYWQRITKVAMNKTQTIIDSKAQLIYVLVPLDGATTPNLIFVGDYSNGVGWKEIKWFTWFFTTISPVSILLRINATTKVPVLCVAGYAGNIYNQVVDTYNDDGGFYINRIRFALLYLQPNQTHHFGMIGLRIRGNGTLLLSGYGEDTFWGDVADISFPSITLALFPGREYQVPILFNGEKLAVGLSLGAVNKFFRLRVMTLYANLLWPTKPFAG